MKTNIIICRHSDSFNFFFSFFIPASLRYPLLLSIIVFKLWWEATCVSALASADWGPPLSGSLSAGPSLSSLPLTQEIRDLVFVFLLVGYPKHLEEEQENTMKQNGIWNTLKSLNNSIQWEEREPEVRHMGLFSAKNLAYFHSLVQTTFCPRYGEFLETMLYHPIDSVQCLSVGHNNVVRLNKKYLSFFTN